MRAKNKSAWASALFAVVAVALSVGAEEPPVRDSMVVPPELPTPTSSVDRVVTILEQRVETNQVTPLQGARPSIQVQVGQDLRILNGSSELQNVYSESGGPSGAGFDRNLEPGESWGTSFSREGTYLIRNALALTDKEFNVVVVGACAEGTIWSGETCVGCGAVGQPQCTGEDRCSHDTIPFEHTCCARAEASLAPKTIEVEGRVDEVDCSDEALENRARETCERMARDAGATYAEPSGLKFTNQKSWRRLGIGRKMCSSSLGFKCSMTTFTCVE